MLLSAVLFISMQAVVATAALPVEDCAATQAKYPDAVCVDGSEPVPKPAPPPAPKKHSKPDIKVLCSRYAEGNAFKATTYLAKVIIANPDDKLWCPKVEWRIEAGNEEVPIGSQESNCEPTVEELWTSGQHEFQLPPGEFWIRARLVKAGRQLADEGCFVRIP